MEPIHIETTSDGWKIEIFPDCDAESPRQYDNLGTFWTGESSYKSPDTMPEKTLTESVRRMFCGDGTRAGDLRAMERAAIVLPVWKYEHSGVIYRAAETNPFSCPWDSGQVGWIFVDKAKVRAEYGCKRITPKVRSNVVNYLKAEVDAYSAWANGDFCGYVVTDPSGEEGDSCWGFESLEAALQEAKEALPAESDLEANESLAQ